MVELACSNEFQEYLFLSICIALSGLSGVTKFDQGSGN